MTHTPGPWHWDKDPQGYMDMPQLMNKDSKIICTFGDSTQYEELCGGPPDIDDAILIAAAPDLLKALEWCHDVYKDTLPMHIQNLIKEVKGES